MDRSNVSSWHVPVVRRMIAHDAEANVGRRNWAAGVEPKLTRSMLARRPRETLNDLDELVVCSATGIAKLVDLMFIRELVQAH